MELISQSLDNYSNFFRCPNFLEFYGNDFKGTVLRSDKSAEAVLGLMFLITWFTDFFF